MSVFYTCHFYLKSSRTFARKAVASADAFGAVLAGILGAVIGLTARRSPVAGPTGAGKVAQGSVQTAAAPVLAGRGLACVGVGELAEGGGVGQSALAAVLGPTGVGRRGHEGV